MSSVSDSNRKLKKSYKKRRFSRRKKSRIGKIRSDLGQKSLLKKRRRSKIGSSKKRRKRSRKKLCFSRNAYGPNWVHVEPPIMSKQQKRDYKNFDYYEFCYDC
jgi:hypothetical protein